MAWISNHIYYIVRKWLLICVLLSAVVLTKTTWMGHTVSHGCKHWNCANINADFGKLCSAPGNKQFLWISYSTKRSLLILEGLWWMSELVLMFYRTPFSESENEDDILVHRLISLYICIYLSRMQGIWLVMPSRLFYEFNSLVSGKFEWNFM